MLTVACVWVRSDIYDSPEWVVRLYSMVNRWIGCSNYPFEFVCITPHLEEFGKLEFIHAVRPSLRLDDSVKPWWYKANLWSLERERVLYFDLDVVLLKGIGPLVDYPSDLVVAPSSGTPMRQHAFNSSVMCWNPDCHQVKKTIREGLKSKPWEKWVGDQQWLSMLPMRVDLYPSRWIHKYKPADGSYSMPSEAIVVLLIQGGKNKRLIEDGHDWVARAWM